MQEIHLRLGSDIRSTILDISHDPDNGKPGIAGPKPDSLADGIGSRPDIDSQGVIHNYGSGCSIGFLVTEESALHERYPHCAEIIGADDLCICNVSIGIQIGRADV